VVTVNTATDRELGFERGLVVGYLDTAIDALSHLKERTSAGRAWLISEENLEEALQWLTGCRQEVLRKEQIDGRNVRREEERPPASWLKEQERLQRGGNN
jgi:hypothetical protein